MTNPLANLHIPTLVVAIIAFAILFFVFHALSHARKG